MVGFAWRSWRGGLLFLEGKRQPFIAVAALAGDFGLASDPLGLCLARLGLAVASSQSTYWGRLSFIQLIHPQADAAPYQNTYKVPAYPALGPVGLYGTCGSVPKVRSEMGGVDGWDGKVTLAWL